MQRETRTSETYQKSQTLSSRGRVFEITSSTPAPKKVRKKFFDRSANNQRIRGSRLLGAEHDTSASVIKINRLRVASKTHGKDPIIPTRFPGGCLSVWSRLEPRAVRQHGNGLTSRHVTNLARLKRTESGGRARVEQSARVAHDAAVFKVSEKHFPPRTLFNRRGTIRAYFRSQFPIYRFHLSPTASNKSADCLVEFCALATHAEKVERGCNGEGRTWFSPSDEDVSTILSIYSRKRITGSLTISRFAFLTLLFSLSFDLPKGENYTGVKQ